MQLSTVENNESEMKKNPEKPTNTTQHKQQTNKQEICTLKENSYHIESCVRKLKALKLETKGYGSILIPLLKDKLPDDLKIVISRKFGGSVWTLDLLLQYLNEELRAQENRSEVMSRSERHEEERFIYSASCYLYTQIESTKCIFCKKNGHTSAKCRKITNSRP